MASKCLTVERNIGEGRIVFLCAKSPKPFPPIRRLEVVRSPAWQGSIDRLLQDQDQLLPVRHGCSRTRRLNCFRNLHRLEYRATYGRQAGSKLGRSWLPHFCIAKWRRIKKLRAKIDRLSRDVEAHQRSAKFGRMPFVSL